MQSVPGRDRDWPAKQKDFSRGTGTFAAAILHLHAANAPTGLARTTLRRIPFVAANLAVR
jgi:hypothetical protein